MTFNPPIRLQTTHKRGKLNICSEPSGRGKWRDRFARSISPRFGTRSRGRPEGHAVGVHPAAQGVSDRGCGPAFRFKRGRHPPSPMQDGRVRDTPQSPKQEAAGHRRTQKLRKLQPLVISSQQPPTFSDCFQGFPWLSLGVAGQRLSASCLVLSRNRNESLLSYFGNVRFLDGAKFFLWVLQGNHQTRGTLPQKQQQHNTNQKQHPDLALAHFTLHIRHGTGKGGNGANCRIEGPTLTFV